MLDTEEELQRLVNALGESRERFQMLFDHAPVAMAFVASDGQVLLLNARFTQLLGYDIRHVPHVDQWFVQAFPEGPAREAARERWRNALPHVGKTPMALPTAEYELRCYDGSTCIAESGGIALPDGMLVPEGIAADVLAHLDQPDQTLIDARAAPRYRGEVEPLDPVAGHIPGALNRPFGLNIDEQGRFKPAATLRAEFEALLAGRDPASVVHQCGSGVSALPNLLAMEVAGFAPTRLFAGSWSEWCRDPSRPVAKG